MFSLQLGQHIKTVLAALAMLALTAGSSSAGVIINFDELLDEAGIELTGFDINGTPFDVTKLGSEIFHISTPAVPSGYTPDAILSHIGISRTSAGFLINILESAGGPISDQVWVHQFIPLFTVIDFISDESQFVTGVQPFATVVETGNLQNALSYTNDRGELVSMNVRSDVPEPATLALLSLGLAGLGFSRRRKPN